VSKYGQMGEDWRFSRLRPFLLIWGMSKYGRGSGLVRKILLYIWLWDGHRGRDNARPTLAKGGHVGVVGL